MKKYNSGKWTQARFNSFIKSALRKATLRWGPKYEVLKDAQTERKINPLSGKLAMMYICGICKEEFPRTQIEVDHIEAVVPHTGFTTWDDVIHRMFCEEEGFIVLCKKCHKEKTVDEKQRRRNIKEVDRKRA